MTDKYYTPTIEEFHTGFEYEYLQPGGAWAKHNLDGNPIIQCELDEYADDLMKLAHAITRVKYLKKEDIESFGWKFYWNHHSELIFQLNGWTLTYNTEAHKVQLNKDDAVYIQKLIIKNKSEFKKLMKQLEI